MAYFMRLDLVMEHMGGGEARRLTLRLVNRPTDAQPVVRNTPRVTVPPAPENDRVFDYLPADREFSQPARTPTPVEGPPAVMFGGVGLTFGLVIGGLLAYLLGLIG